MPIKSSEVYYSKMERRTSRVFNSYVRDWRFLPMNELKEDFIYIKTNSED